MITFRHATAIVSAFATLSVAAYAQQSPQQPSSAPPASPSTTTTTTTTTRSAPPAGFNSDTNSQPDITGTSGHPDATVRIKQDGGLASAMANFSVRTGLEIRPNANAQVVVHSVRPDSPSARAGVEAGDVITKLSGTEVSTVGEFQKLISQPPLRSAYFITFKRGDHGFRIPLGRQLGLLGMTVFPDAADRPVVQEVERSTPADRAGLRVGDVITGVDHHETATMDRLLDFAVPFIRNMSEGQGIPFQVVREGKPVKLSITRPTDADLPLLTQDQERHLRHLANGDDKRPRREPRPRRVTRTTTTTTQTTGGNQMNAVNGQLPNQNGYGAVGGVAGGVGGVGLGLDAGLGGTGVGTGLGTSGTTGMNGTSSNVNAVVAVLRATPSSLNGQTSNSGQQGTTSATGATGNSGMNAGTVGFVQIQANIGLNGQNNAPSNINPSAPGANPITGNTTTNTGVNPGTGNAATNTLNPNAAATNSSQLQAQQQQGAANGVNGTNGLNGVNNGTNGANGTNNGMNGTNGTNNGTNGTATTPTQSFVSARISGVPAGTYTLSVNQFGDCGDVAGAAPGPAVLNLGTITVSANGGSLPNQTVNFAPQAFLGRTVSLVPASGGTLVGSPGGQSLANSQSSGQTSGLIACGKFFSSNQGNQGNQGNSFIGGNNGGIGGVGTTNNPTMNPTGNPTTNPAMNPSANPTTGPIPSPARNPTTSPTAPILR
jgi:PDZ domain